MSKKKDSFEESRRVWEGNGFRGYKRRRSYLEQKVKEYFEYIMEGNLNIK